MLVNIREHRKYIEEKDKSPRDKLMSLSEAVKRFVRDGCIIAIGGCLYSRTPMAAIHEIIRQRFKSIKVCRGLAGFEVDLLIASGTMDHLITSWCSPGYAWGLSKVLSQSVVDGKVMFEEWSHLGIGLRLKAAAMGVPFLPTFSMLGSDIMNQLNLEKIKCPYSGETVALVPALFPDVGIIHAHRADRYGNVQVDGYTHFDKYIALASKHVIITVEEIVESDFFRKQPDRTFIPFFCVDAVVKVPYGAYPTECWNEYDTDFKHLSDYHKIVVEKGTAGVNDYINEHIYTTSSFEEFLKKVGTDRFLLLRHEFRQVLE
jgi:glutaconate CoA-transferase subunit A